MPLALMLSNPISDQTNLLCIQLDHNKPNYNTQNFPAAVAVAAEAAAADAEHNLT
jgi:hypothetical protein